MHHVFSWNHAFQSAQPAFFVGEVRIPMCKLFGADYPFESPKEMEYWEKLGAVCHFESFEKERLFEMLGSLNAPANLQGLVPVLDNTLLLLPHIERLSGLNSEEHECWIEHIEQIQSSLKGLSDQQLNDLSLLQVRARKNRGVLKSNPFFGLLLYLDGFSDRSAALNMVAWATKFMWRHGDQDSPSMRYKICLSLRTLLGEWGVSSLGSHLERLPAEKIADRLENLLDDGVEDSADRERLSLLKRYFEDQTKRRDGVTRRSGYTRGGVNYAGIRGSLREVESAPVTILVRDEKGLAEPEKTHLAVEKSENLVFVPKGDVGSDIKDAGIWKRDCGADLLKIQEHLDSKLPVRASTDPVRKHYQKTQIAAEITASAQPLPYLWSILTPWEVLIFLKELDTLAEMDAELALILLICLFRGCSVKDATKVYGKGDELLPRRVYLEVGEQSSAWWLPVHIGIKLAAGTEDCEGYGLPSVSHFRIGLPSEIHQLFSAYLTRGASELQPGGRLTKLKGSTATSNLLEKWVSQVNRRNRTRLTLLRIRRFFALRSRSVSNQDPVHGAYLQGRYELESETQIYYTRTTEEAIEASYQDFWQQIFDDIREEWSTLAEAVPDWLAAAPSIHQEVDSGTKPQGIGAKKVPKKSAVQEMVAHIEANLEQSRQILPVHRRTIEYHNQYMLYTLTYLTWASGYRAVASPLPDPRLLDRQSGLLLISDKDAEDGYCSRLVWLTEDCVRQVEYYLEHLSALTLRMAGYAPDFHAAYRCALEHWQRRPPAVGNKRWNLEAETDFTPFVYLDEKGFHPIRPRTVRKLLPRGYQLPLDSNRHYLRSYLLRRGCDSALIDTQMGHWHQGFEPWARASSLSPSHYMQSIKPHLETMLDELGFRARPSKECV